MTLFTSVIYIQIRRRWISLRVLSWSGGDSRWEGVPDVQIVRDKKGREWAIPLGAQPPRNAVASRIYRGLDHPRVLIGNPHEFELSLQLLMKMAGYKRSPSKPVFVIQIAEPLEGGLTDLEAEALRRIASHRGCSRCIILEQPQEMSPPDVLSLVRGQTRAIKRT